MMLSAISSFSPCLLSSVLLTLSMSILSGCGGSSSSNSSSEDQSTSPTSPEESASNSTACVNSQLASIFNIQSIPQQSAQGYKSAFCKYMSLKAPNGKPIEIFAQSEITDEQLIRAHSILRFYLEDIPGTTHGADKSSVANAMANNGAKLLLMNGSDNGVNDPTVEGQPLYASELIVEGSTAYINNDYENHRDAAFEEILHLMHDYGIGTTDEHALPGALPNYSAAIDKARSHAMNHSLWPTSDAANNTTEWINELRNEGSLSQEYLASVIDSYYGYWGANTESSGGMWGIYIAKNRDQINELDPMGAALVKEYFNPLITYTARIDSGFTGDFSLEFDTTKAYTHKSQYLINAQLTGSLDSDLSGNAHDNQLAGNAGTNTLDGGAGNDIAILSGSYDDYIINIVGDEIHTQDSIANRDGITTLLNIEAVLFAEQWYLFENGRLIFVDEAEQGVPDVRNMRTTDSQTVRNEHIAITLNFKEQLQLVDGTKAQWDSAQQQPYIDAANQWLETLISAGSQQAHELSIDVAVADLSMGNGAAAPYIDSLQHHDGSYFPTGGEIIISNYTYSNEFTEELGKEAALAEFNANILHEIGHVIGIGSLWNLHQNHKGEITPAELGQGNLRRWVTYSDQHDGLIYQQPRATEAYNAYFDTTFDFAPVSPGHLYSSDQNETMDEDRHTTDGTLIPGTPEDLMANGTQITSILLGFLQDLGWVVNTSTADRETP